MQTEVGACPHKTLKKQMSGMQVWYVCEAMSIPVKKNGLTVSFRQCGQKFKAETWDGRVKVTVK